MATGALVIRIAASGSHPTAAALKHCVGECQEGVRALRQEGEAVAHLAAPPGVAVNRHYRPSPLHACDQHRASGPLRTDQHSVTEREGGRGDAGAELARLAISAPELSDGKKKKLDIINS